VGAVGTRLRRRPLDTVQPLVPRAVSMLLLWSVRVKTEHLHTAHHEASLGSSSRLSRVAVSLVA